jgi:hypothetical protein
MLLELTLDVGCFGRFVLEAEVQVHLRLWEEASETASLYLPEFYSC